MALAAWIVTFVGGILFLIGVVSLLWSIRQSDHRVRKMLLRTSDVHRLADLQQGAELVRISGRVRAGPQGFVTSPIQQAPALLYRTNVLVRAGHESTTWRTVHREGAGNNFWIDDGSNVLALVRAEDLCLVLRVDFEVQAPHVPPPLLEWLRERSGVTSHRLRFEEKRIVEGDEVTAIGKLLPEVGTDGRQLLVLTNPPSQRLFLSNLPAGEAMAELHSNVAVSFGLVVFGVVTVLAGQALTLFAA